MPAFIDTGLNLVDVDRRPVLVGEGGAKRESGIYWVAKT
jgi:hypothetical protein